MKMFASLPYNGEIYNLGPRIAQSTSSLYSHFNPLNYRPIALTSCICKTVERMVNERLVWYLAKNGLLAKQQCDYRANRSTVDHLIRMETFIRDAFIQNQHLIAVFLNLQKAYDTTWKHGIQQDLHDMDLRGNLPIFIGNFFN